MKSFSMPQLSVIRVFLILTMMAGCMCHSSGQSDIFSIEHFESLGGMDSYEMVNRINARGHDLKSEGNKTHRLDSIGIWSKDFIQQEFKQTGIVNISYSDTLEIQTAKNPENDCSSNDCRIHKLIIDPNNNKVVSSIRFNNWDGSHEQLDTFHPSQVLQFFYDSNDFLRKVTFPEAEYIYTYDTGNLIELQSYRKENPQDTFQLDWSVNYHHDTSDNLESIVFYDMPPNGILVAQDSIHITYDNNSNILNKSEYAPLSGNSWWKNLNHDYFYTNDKLSTIELESLDPAGTVSSRILEEAYSYQSSGDINRISGRYIEDFEDPIFTHYYQYNNDDNIPIEDVQYPIDYIFGKDYNEWNTMILTEESFEIETLIESFGTEKIKREYFYTELNPSNTTSLSEDLEINIFPNPASSELNIATTEFAENLTLTLYDLYGKELLNQSIYNGSKISIADFTPGVYIYKVTKDNGQSTSGNIVVVK